MQYPPILLALRQPSIDYRGCREPLEPSLITSVVLVSSAGVVVHTAVL